MDRALACFGSDGSVLAARDFKREGKSLSDLATLTDTTLPVIQFTSPAPGSTQNLAKPESL
jgi:hypothetical protein